jgi:hypothetical protein
MMNLDEKTVSTYKLRILQNQFKTMDYLFNEKHKLVSLNCVIMSGHLSGKEKERFQLLVYSKKKRLCFFCRITRKNVGLLKQTRGITIEDMVIYEDLHVSFGRAKTYQCNLESEKGRQSN